VATTVKTTGLQQEIGKRDPFEVAEQEAYLNIARTRARAAAGFAELFRSHGLSEPQYNALRIAGASGTDGVRCDTIAERMVGLDPDVTRLIDRLEKAGLVARARCTRDRRCVYVAATAAGRALLRKLHPKVEALHRAQFGHLSGSELAALNRLLVKARAELPEATR